jgi:hypothetical protein
LLPGVILHETAHWIFLQGFGFRNLRLTLLPDAPNVLGHIEFTYYKNLRSYIGITLSAIAPLFFGMAALFLIAKGMNVKLIPLLEELTLLGDWDTTFTRLFEHLATLPIWLLCLGGYGYSVVALTMTPSHQDLRSMAKPGLMIICVLVAIFGLLWQLGVDVPTGLAFSLMWAAIFLQWCFMAALLALIGIAGLYGFDMLIRKIIGQLRQNKDLSSKSA